MILNALTKYYEILKKEGKVGKDGWDTQKVSYAITLDEDGQVRGIVPLMTPEIRGKKEVMVPVLRLVPLHKGRTSGTTPYFMCDNAKYLLGAWVKKTEQEKANKCFEKSKEYHIKILEGSNHPLAKSVCNFFNTWNFEKQKDNFKLNWEEVLKGSNLIFRSFETKEEFLENKEMQEIWDGYSRRGTQQEKGRCLITGEMAPIAKLHPMLKGVKGAQSSGAALVSFNWNAFESYGKERGENAPISEYAAGAYAKALNYLLSKENETHHRVIADTTTVFWAETEKNGDSYAQFVAEFFDDIDEPEEEKLLRTMDSIAKGIECTYKEGELKPETKFYLLGLSPNAGRISIRFFYFNTFGDMVSNIKKHYERMEIQSPVFEKKKYPSIRDIVNETVNQKTTNKKAPKKRQNGESKSDKPEDKREKRLAGELMRSILEDGRYPAALYSQLMLRVHSERKINRNRAAIIKAFIMKNYPNKKEVVESMELNEETEYVPYILGRLFAVLEDIQRISIEKKTLKDRYFNAASSTPAVIFPLLLKLSNSYMRVLEREKKGLKIVKEEELRQLIGKMHGSFPARLSLEDQGIFMIGYYHQVPKFCPKKEDKTNNKEKQEGSK